MGFPGERAPHSFGPVKTTTPRRQSAGLRAHLGRYPAAIWVLLSGGLLVRAAGFAFPFMSYHIAGHGHGVQAIGAVLAAFGLGCVAGQLICGWLCDRFGRRITLVMTLLTAAAVLILLAAAASLPVLLAGAAVAGLVYDAPRPVASAVIGDLVADPRERARLDALRLGLIANVGAAIAGGLGGVLASWAGAPVLFVINGAACAVFAMMAWFGIPPDLGRRRAQQAASYRQALSDSRLVLLLFSGVATMTALVGLLSVIPMVMTTRGLGAASYGLVQAANALAVVVLTPLMTSWLCRRTSSQPRLGIRAAAGLWTAVTLGLAALAHSTVGFALAVIACAPGQVAWFVVSIEMVHRIAPPEQRGRYHGLWGTALAVAAVLAPPLVALSLSFGGQPLAGAAIAIVGLLGVALCWPPAPAVDFSAPSPSVVRKNKKENHIDHHHGITPGHRAWPVGALSAHVRPA